jgi:nucleotide-binding universal stress UspA family protein
LVCHPGGAITPAGLTYAHYLGNLLDGQLDVVPPHSVLDMSRHPVFAAEGRDYDLVIIEEPAKAGLKQLFCGPSGSQAMHQFNSPILVARYPRLPLETILVVTRGQTIDNPAIDWGIRLARPSGAAVTVLAVQPTLSGLTSRALAGAGLADWLDTETPLGWQLRQVVRELIDWEHEGRLRFRDGSPDEQIRHEVGESEPDLIIIAADSPNWLMRRVPGPLVGPLLGWTDRPVLIAGSGKS